MIEQMEKKLRVWLKKQKRFSYHNLLLQEDVGGLAFILEENIPFETQQYSGKSDINGKEIYEYDIIEFEEPMFESEMIRGYVILEDATFLVKCGKEEFELRKIKEPEIIGNKFSNPDLLK